MSKIYCGWRPVWYGFAPLLAAILTLCVPWTAEGSDGAGVPPRHGSTTEAVFFVPLFGHGRQGNLRFSSEITILNLSKTTSARVVLESFDGEGTRASLIQLGDMATNNLALDVAASGTREVASLNDHPEEMLDSGWVRVVAPASIEIEVVFRIVDADTEALITSANVSVFEATTGATFSARVTSGLDTGMALLDPFVNPDAEVTIEAFNRNGISVGQVERTLESGHRTAEFIGDILELTDFTGSIEVRSSQPLAILPLRQEDVVLTTQPIHPARE